jgi:Protein of unknown function (DUF4199)
MKPNSRLSPRFEAIILSSMKKNVTIFGLILGVVLAGNMLYMVTLVYNDPSFQGNDIVGYAGMIVVFSLTFFGVRNFRNKELGGVISLGKAFKTGALIALVGSTMYVGVWLIYYYLFVPDFIDKYTEHCMIVATRTGATTEELSAKADEMKQLRDMYQSPFFVILITYAEVLPVGLVVAFVSSLVLKKKTASK